MSVSIYRWNDACRSLGASWADVVRSHGLNPSLHPDWMGITLEAHGFSDKAVVAHVKTAAGNVAFLPLIPRTVTIGGLPLRCLDLVSNLVSYHVEAIASGDHDAVLSELIACKQLPRWDVLRFSNLVSAGPTALAIEAIGKTGVSGVLNYPGERSPYIDMSLQWDEYLRALPKKVRANIIRCIRQTQQAGETGMVWYEQGGDAEKLLADILEVESRSWKATDNKAIRSDAIEGRYYQQLLPWLSQNGLFANVLYVNHRPCAYVLCARWQGWVGQLKTSFAQDVRDAGFRVIHASIERAFANQEREYDFLGDAAPHKLRWTDRIRAHEDKWIFAAHWRGRALFAAKRAIDAWRRNRAAKQAAKLPVVAVEE